jgi:hypothetical protein
MWHWLGCVSRHALCRTARGACLPTHPNNMWTSPLAHLVFFKFTYTCIYTFCSRLSTSMYKNTRFIYTCIHGHFLLQKYLYQHKKPNIRATVHISLQNLKIRLASPLSLLTYIWIHYRHNLHTKLPCNTAQGLEGDPRSQARPGHRSASTWPQARHSEFGLVMRWDAEADSWLERIPGWNKGIYAFVAGSDPQSTWLDVRL